MKTVVQPAIDLVFRALSDPTRLRILGLLRAGELCVCDLVTTLRIHQPMASRHLAYLRRAALVKVRKQGHWAYYRLAEPSGSARRRLMECLPGCIDELPGARADARRMSAACVGRRCCD